MQSTRKIAHIGRGVVYQLGDFVDVSCVDDTMVLQTQRDRARHECDPGEVLANSVMQFLAQALLLSVADSEDFALESFAPPDLIFQLLI